MMLSNKLNKVLRWGSELWGRVWAGERGLDQGPSSIMVFRTQFACSR